MDHSHHDHSAMLHGASDAAASAMDMCNMNMLFTWSTKDLCIVFRWWHIKTTPGLLLSLFTIVLLTAAYEALRSASRKYEAWSTKRSEEVPIITESTPFLWSGRNQVEVSKRAHFIKAALYAVQNFYAFMLMLLFMTYNGWVMIAVAVGAFVGYVIFGGNTSSTKDGACH